MVLEKPTSFDSLVHEKMQRCPRCRAPVEKSEGCNQMTCRCGNHFGYVCSAELPRQNPYDHFQGKDACPLFDGQEEGQEEIDEEEEEEQAKRTRRRREKRGWLCGFLLKCTELGPAARAKSPLSKACACS